MAHNNIDKYYSQEELKGTFEKIKTLLIILLKNNTTEATVKDVISLYESGICRQKLSSELPPNFKEDLIISLLIFAVIYSAKSENDKEYKRPIGDILSSQSNPGYRSMVWVVARMINSEEIGVGDVLPLLQGNENIRNILIEALSCEINNPAIEEPETLDECLKRLRIPKKSNKL